MRLFSVFNIATSLLICNIHSVLGAAIEKTPKTSKRAAGGYQNVVYYADWYVLPQLMKPYE